MYCIKYQENDRNLSKCTYCEVPIECWHTHHAYELIVWILQCPRHISIRIIIYGISWGSLQVERMLWMRTAGACKRYLSINLTVCDMHANSESSERCYIFKLSLLLQMVGFRVRFSCLFWFCSTVSPFLNENDIMYVVCVKNEDEREFIAVAPTHFPSRLLPQNTTPTQTQTIRLLFIIWKQIFGNARKKYDKIWIWIVEIDLRGYLMTHEPFIPCIMHIDE